MATQTLLLLLKIGGSIEKSKAYAGDAERGIQRRRNRSGREPTTAKKAVRRSARADFFPHRGSSIATILAAISLAK
jgi:hypothetical protein